MADHTIQQELDRILKWLQQNSDTTPIQLSLLSAALASVTTGDLEMDEEYRENLESMKEALGVPGRIDVRPITARDVEQLLDEIVSVLKTRNLLTVFRTDWLPLSGAQREAGRIKAKMSLALRDAVTWLFLGNPLPDSFLDSTRGQLLTAEMIKQATLVASDFLTNAIKLPKAPTRARQMTQYLQGVRRSLVDSGRITQEFWTDAFSSSPSKGGSEFAFGVFNAFERVRADVFTDLEAIDREMDFVGRVRRSIRRHEIEPRKEGVFPGDPNADFWFVMPDEQDEQTIVAQRRMAFLQALNLELSENPDKAIDRLMRDKGFPTDVSLYASEQEKEAFRRLKAVLKDSLLTTVSQMGGMASQDIAQTVLANSNVIFDTAASSFEQARQRAVAAEQEKRFAERRIDTLGKADTAVREWAAVNGVGLDPATTDQLKRLIFAVSQDFGAGSGLLPPSVAQIFSELGITPKTIRQQQVDLKAAQGQAAIRAAALQSPDAIVENQLIRLGLLRSDTTPEQLAFLRDRFVGPISLALGIALRQDSQLDVEAFIRARLDTEIGSERQVDPAPFEGIGPETQRLDLSSIGGVLSAPPPITIEEIPETFQRLFGEQQPGIEARDRGDRARSNVRVYVFAALVREGIIDSDASPEEQAAFISEFVDPITFDLTVALAADENLDPDAFIANAVQGTTLQEGLQARTVRERTAVAKGTMQAQEAALFAEDGLKAFVQGIVVRRWLPRDASPEMVQFVLSSIVPPIVSALNMELLRRPSGPLSNVFFDREDFVMNRLSEDLGLGATEFGKMDVPLPTVQDRRQALQTRFAGHRGQLPETGGFPIVASPGPASFEQRIARAEREFEPFPGLFREAAGESLPFLNFLTGQSGRVLQEFRGSEVPGIPLSEVESRLQVRPSITGGDPNAEPGFPDPGTGLLGATPTVRFAASSGERANLIRALGAPSRPTQERFFGGLLPTLREEFRTSPSGLAEQLTTNRQAESERLAAEAETLAETARQQTTRQRRLRGGGRTVTVSRR